MFSILACGEFWVKPAQDLIYSSDLNGHEGFACRLGRSATSSLSLSCIFRQEALANRGSGCPIWRMRSDEVGDGGFYAWSLNGGEFIPSFASSASFFLSPFHDFRRFGVRSHLYGFYKENLSFVFSPGCWYHETLTCVSFRHWVLGVPNGV